MVTVELERSEGFKIVLKEVEFLGLSRMDMGCERKERRIDCSSLALVNGKIEVTLTEMEKPQDEDNKPVKGLISLITTAAFWQPIYLLPSLCLCRIFMLRISGQGRINSLYNLESKSH